MRKQGLSERILSISPPRRSIDHETYPYFTWEYDFAGYDSGEWTVYKNDAGPTVIEDSLGLKFPDQGVIANYRWGIYRTISLQPKQRAWIMMSEYFHVDNLHLGIIAFMKIGDIYYGVGISRGSGRMDILHYHDDSTRPQEWMSNGYGSDDINVVYSPPLIIDENVWVQLGLRKDKTFDLQISNNENNNVPSQFDFTTVVNKSDITPVVMDEITEVGMFFKDRTGALDPPDYHIIEKIKIVIQ